MVFAQAFSQKACVFDQTFFEKVCDKTFSQMVFAQAFSQKACVFDQTFFEKVCNEAFFKEAFKKAFVYSLFFQGLFVSFQ